MRVPLATSQAQVNHANWAGLTPYDLIFPLFVFIVGVSLVFSLSTIMQTRGRVAALKRVVTRSVLLYLLGLLYYGGLSRTVQDIRLLGVLQRIALCYFFSGYVLVAGGYSLMLLALFYQIIDVWHLRWWAMPFVWVGTNAITLYLAINFLDFKYL